MEVRLPSRLLSEALDSAGATAISRRFQLALGWLAVGAFLGALLPVLGMAVIIAFNAFTGSQSEAKIPPAT